MLPIWLEFLMFFGFWPLFFFCLGLIVFMLWFWYRRTPFSARNLAKAIREKIPIILAQFDDGRCAFFYSKAFNPEGIIKTMLNKKTELTFFLPRPFEVMPTGENSEIPSETKQMKARGLISQPMHLHGAPLTVGYAGTGVGCNLKTLANVQYGPSNNPTSDEEKKMAPFFPVDLRTIEFIFPLCWSQSQIKANEKTAELRGLARGEKYFGEKIKPWMPLLIILGLILGICAVIFLAR